MSVVILAGAMKIKYAEIDLYYHHLPAWLQKSWKNCERNLKGKMTMTYYTKGIDIDIVQISVTYNMNFWQWTIWLKTVLQF